MQSHDMRCIYVSFVSSFEGGGAGGKLLWVRVARKAVMLTCIFGKVNHNCFTINEGIHTRELINMLRTIDHYHRFFYHHVNLLSLVFVKLHMLRLAKCLHRDFHNICAFSRVEASTNTCSHAHASFSSTACSPLSVFFASI